MAMTKSEKLVAAKPPLPERLILKGRMVASKQHILLNASKRKGLWVGVWAEMPSVIAHGKTVGKCVDAIREAIAGAVAVMLKMGQAPPESINMATFYPKGKHGGKPVTAIPVKLK